MRSSRPADATRSRARYPPSPSSQELKLVIGTPEPPEVRWERYRKAPDWIEQYVFPGCLIPSLTSLANAATSSSKLTILEVDEIGPHYAETLRRWRANVHARIDDVRALGYDERFERTWDFYLAFCEAGFRTRALRDVQITLSRPLNESVAF